MRAKRQDVRLQGVHCELITALQAELARVADPAKAPGMQAYMKSRMPYLGVPMPQLRAVCRPLFAAHTLIAFEEWRGTTLTLWREATYREERYAAIALTGDPRYRDFQTLEALPMYEEMIVTGAWWDYVDELATHRVGTLLRRFPAAMRETMLLWSRDDKLWKRRAAILCQASFKAATDEALLFACIEPNMRDREFFIRKAIGWALREYAKTRPEAVREFVRLHETSLSPLSRREATRRLGQDSRDS